MAARKIHFVSLGCVKNRVDTEVMLGVADRDGWRIVDEAEEAEVIVVNTCGFIGEAKKESIDTILELSEYKRVGSCKKLVVTGCLAQRYAADLAKQMPEIDHLLGSSDMLRLGEVLEGDAERVLVGNPADWLVRASDPRVVTQSRASAWIKIAEGCNRTCSFCVIPQIRGAQRSRSADDIVAEAERLVAQGAIELNLVSQDTIAWGRDRPRADRSPLAELVHRIADVSPECDGYAFSTCIQRRSTMRSSSSSRRTRVSSPTSTCPFSMPPTRCSSACGAGTDATDRSASSNAYASASRGSRCARLSSWGIPAKPRAEFDEEL